ncbi:cache domain-containing protein [Streptomyces sp. AC495_CC817]|uniref:cache domain-containing protein n=1 Tax=Streptomyces sp. AC495_CC817 TaxID=2823900 RepID=UPI001C251E3F|nr:cache domain-containing protein [Streptomyces sp. AC495_CC817]
MPTQSDQDSIEPALDRAIEEADDFFDGLFAPFEEWAPRLSEQLAERLEAGPLTGPQLVALVADDALRILDDTDRPIFGAGFCMGEGIVSDGNPLAWWQGAERTLVASSIFGSGQTAIGLYRLEWYRVPESTGRRHVAGPFVDYLCSNELNLTVSLPIVIDGSVIGIAGADVLVTMFERALLPIFAGIPRLTLVNDRGRVVITTDPAYETGDRLAGMGSSDTLDHLGPHWHLRRSARYPFAVVTPTA